MLAHLAPSSLSIQAMLLGCFFLVLAFEASNGFHDTANAVATVIYTQALKPVQAVLWSGILNFAGVLLGGIAVAYALVEILPPDVLTPPDGAPAVPMLVAIFTTALFWNVLTWRVGIPNSSSHCIIGALVGVACGDSVLHARGLGRGIDWHQIRAVLESLALSPFLGLIGAGGLYGVLRFSARNNALLRAPVAGERPVWWLRAMLILTCGSVSLSHGTNDGQKSIGLIMLTVIGLMPAAYALNPHATASLQSLPANLDQAIPLIARLGDDLKSPAIGTAQALHHQGPAMIALAQAPTGADRREIARFRGMLYDVLGQLKHAQQSPLARAEDRDLAGRLRHDIGPLVHYAPLWVRLLSALCLGAGTMVGYQRVVRTLGERLGRQKMTPGQGASAELVGAILIGTAGLTGLPVSTTHIITSGIAGTMIAGGQGVRLGMVTRIGMAWLLTLPATILIAGCLFYLLDTPNL